MRVAVIGAGSWGTAIAGLLANKGYKVHLWARRAAIAEAINTTHKNPDYLSDYELPEGVIASSNISESVAG